jgi:pyridoxamine 5'-phosphate oxidase
MRTRPTELPFQNLPDPLPANPLELAAQWLAEAEAAAAQPNPNAMVLATTDGSGQPSARVVLCKEIAAARGYLTFFSNYQSRKGRELLANPRAAVVFHWDHLHRQVRAEGRVAMLPDADSDAYFRTRSWQSRVGAWASRQSEPVASLKIVSDAMRAAAQRFGIIYGGPGTPEPAATGVDVPRPPFWGGFRLDIDAVELWVEGAFRIHDRARWTRQLPDPASADAPIEWSALRLQP